MLVSASLFAALGNASRQAVWKARDGRRWLEGRVRAEVAPTPMGSDRLLRGGALRVIMANLDAWLEGALRRVRAFEASIKPHPKGGRPLYHHPGDLATDLGVPERWADSLSKVVRRWVGQLKRRLRSALRGQSSLRRFKVVRLLDALWCRRPRAGQGRRTLRV